jgi:HAD superfamily hydrolase (TIGR01490 family)
VKEPEEVKEIKEVNEVKERRGEIAAFFDLDGTLMARPSFERRFFRLLQYRREIGVRNYLLWLREEVRLVPRGIRKMLQANKMYLRGVQSFDVGEGRGDGVSSRHKSGDQVEGQAVAAQRRNPRLPVPNFFAEAADRMAWHAKEGHAIVLVSGTLEPLAEEAARSLETQLATRGMATRIRVCATRLEKKDGRWTGRILDEAMFGEAKARAAKQLAEEMRLDLGRCYAYGDSLNDRWLMEAVARPAAVNPSKELAGIARTHEWPILNWEEKENPAQRRRERKEAAVKEKTAQRDCGLELVRPGNQG